MIDSTKDNAAKPPIANGQRGRSVIQDLLDFGILSDDEAAYHLEQLDAESHDDQPNRTA